MRLIDADALIKKWYELNDIDENDRGVRFVGYTEIVRWINSEPTIDAVPIVRCKDCKHKYVSGNGTTQYYVCDFMDAQYEENGFCHHAEREIKE